MNYGNHNDKHVSMETDSVASDVVTVGSPNLGWEGDRPCTDGNTTPVMGVKRKGTLSSLRPMAEGSENQIEAGLAYIKSSLVSAMNEASWEVRGRGLNVS
jgi:hypothetical protein